MGDGPLRAALRREEHARARERTKRPTGELTEFEASTLRGLLTYADALGNAYRALEEKHLPEHQAQYVEVMRELKDDAHEQFLRYRREVGLPE